MVNLDKNGWASSRLSPTVHLRQPTLNLVLEVADISTMLVRDASGLFPQQQQTAEDYSNAGTRASPRMRALSNP